MGTRTECHRTRQYVSSVFTIAIGLPRRGPSQKAQSDAEGHQSEQQLTEANQKLPGLHYRCFRRLHRRPLRYLDMAPGSAVPCHFHGKSEEKV
jgi:hypothetical protein